MSILFSPNGSLNVAADPSDLPEDALTRCKNLRLDRPGIAQTRYGSAKLNATAINSINLLVEQGGTRYAFGGGSIYEDESAIATGLTDAQFSAIQYNAFNDTTEQVFCLNGTDRKRIEGSSVHEWGLDAPSAAPTVTTGEGTNLTGDYRVRYTYVRKVGTAVVAESNPSAVSDSVTLSSGSVLAFLTRPSDTQVTHYRIYRTTNGGSTYFLDRDQGVADYGYTQSWETDEISGTGYQFTTTDSAHSTENTFAWEADEDTASDDPDTAISAPFDVLDSAASDAALGTAVETDNDRPPLGSFVFGPAYNGICFIIKDNLLYHCKNQRPESWPATYFVEVSIPQDPGVCGVFHNGQAYFLTKNEIHYIQGTGQGTFFPLPMRARTGAQGPFGAVSVQGKGIYHTGPDGVYLFAGGSDVKISEPEFDPIFRGEAVNGIPAVADMTTAGLFVSGNRLYLRYRSAGFTHPTNVLVINLETNRAVYYEYDDGSKVQIRCMVRDAQNDRILVGDHTGYVRVIERTSDTDDSGTAIGWELQSKDFTLQTRRHFPRWNKYDVDASGAGSCTGALLLDGSVHQSHTITGNRNTRRRLVDVNNGSRAALRLSGTGSVTIYGAESE